MREIPHLIDVFPVHDLGDSVGTRDEEKVRIRSRFADVPQCVNRVGRAGPVNVDATNCKTWICRRRNDRHEVAVLTLGYFGLHPRLTSGNEHHFVKIELLLYFARGHEVTVMNGVERAAHDADSSASLRYLDHPPALTLVARAVCVVARLADLVTVAVRDVAKAPRNESESGKDHCSSPCECEWGHEQRSELLCFGKNGDK
jgi:hypothetical protein